MAPKTKRIPDGVVDLSVHKTYGGKIIITRSPSQPRVTLLWPDGFQQTYNAVNNPHEVEHKFRDPEVGEAVTLGCMIFQRGSSQWDEIRTRMEERDAEIQEAREALDKEFGRKRQEIEGRYLENVSRRVKAPLDAPVRCLYEPPHYDCEICPDPTTDVPPKHFSSPAAEVGHRRGTEHQRLAAEQVSGKAVKKKAAASAA